MSQYTPPSIVLCPAPKYPNIGYPPSRSFCVYNRFSKNSDWYSQYFCINYTYWCQMDVLLLCVLLFLEVSIVSGVIYCCWRYLLLLEVYIIAGWYSVDGGDLLLLHGLLLLEEFVIAWGIHQCLVVYCSCRVLLLLERGTLLLLGGVLLQYKSSVAGGVPYCCCWRTKGQNIFPVCCTYACIAPQNLVWFHYLWK